MRSAEAYMREDHATLRGLEESHGSAFYLFSREGFAANFASFGDAFRRHYPRSTVAYSYKTNYLPWICRYVDANGGLAEVVSPLEYDLATRAGVPRERIILNGPFKEASNVEDALLSGSLVNIDSPYELALLDAICARHPSRVFEIGLRCNFELDSDHISRFGLDVETDLQAAVAHVRGIPNCRLVALHCHYSTSARSVASFASRTRSMLEICQTLFAPGSLKYLDIGGGFFSKMDDRLSAQFGVHIPSFEEYAHATAPLVADAFPADSGPELIVEPGTALAADTMEFVTRVLDVKTVRGRRIALVNASIYNVKPTLNRLSLSVDVVRPRPGSATWDGAATDVVGHTCMEVDCLATVRESVEPGDYLVFRNVGAYTIVLKPAFIHPCAPVLSYSSDTGRYDVLKRQETPDDVFATYVFDRPDAVE